MLYTSSPPDSDAAGLTANIPVRKLVAASSFTVPTPPLLVPISEFSNRFESQQTDTPSSDCSDAALQSEADSIRRTKIYI